MENIREINRAIQIISVSLAASLRGQRSPVRMIGPPHTARYLGVNRALPKVVQVGICTNMRQPWLKVGYIHKD